MIVSTSRKHCSNSYKYQFGFRRVFNTFALIGFLFSSAFALAQGNGEKLFKQNCSSCHQVSTKKLVGPGLLDITKRRSENWLISFIKDSQKLIKSGDADAVKVFKENNELMMPPQNLSEEDIKSILTYIESGGISQKESNAKSPIVEPTEDSQSATVVGSGFMTWMLGLIALILLAVVYFLYRVKKSIDFSKGKSSHSGAGISAIADDLAEFAKNNKKFVVLIILIAGLGLLKAGWDALSSIGISKGYAPAQPIAFSHKIHAGENQISCVYCHSSATKGKTAGIPSANICMNCHKYIQEGTTTGTEEISKIYAALDYDPLTQSYGENPQAIRWIRIHNLPDLAYFNHAQHVVAGKQKCQTCHGKVEEMSVVEQHSSLTMGWCVDCHKNTEVSMEGNAYYNKIHEEYKEKYKGQKITVDKIGGLDCAKCHY
jgi:mono/diheme cytochrome c family protein/cbb3-type cytochrome oxidase subunit 3